MLMSEKETKPRRKRTTPSVGVYLDDKTNDAFSIAVMKEREKQIRNGEKPTISKSSVLADYVKEWLRTRNKKN